MECCFFFAYGISLIFFGWDAVRYFTGVHSFLGLLLIWMLIIPAVWMLPLGSTVLIGFLIYYLATVEDWGYLLAIIYCVPSIAGLFFGVLGAGVEMISGIFSRRSDRY